MYFFLIIFRGGEWWFGISYDTMAVLFVTIIIKTYWQASLSGYVTHSQNKNHLYLNSPYSAIALQPKSAEIKKIISKTDKKLQYLWKLCLSKGIYSSEV